jgi:peptidoglycan/xylan/chitin deacetylase (PgdA/CDA1 family)
MSTLKSIALTFLLGAVVTARPAVQKRLSAGTVYTGCTTPGVVAVTFDDGPYIYTESVLDQFKAAGQHATWFVNGNNYDIIYNYNSTIERIVNEGHQVCSHTWDHADLATLTQAQIESEMTQLEVAFTNILGYFPRYMRPPYISLNTLATQTLSKPMFSSPCTISNFSDSHHGLLHHY